jgi:OOP family OmpA-OmpF porin
MVTVDANALNKRILDTGKAVVYGIHFDLGNAVIKPESKPQLDEIASLLKQHADIRLAITDHTDNRGPADGNQILSQQRGDAIVATLVNDYGIKPYRLSAQGLGASLPIASNDTPEGRAKNRRVELVRLSIGIAP